MTSSVRLPLYCNREDVAVPHGLKENFKNQEFGVKPKIPGWIGVSFEQVFEKDVSFEPVPRKFPYSFRTPTVVRLRKLPCMSDSRVIAWEFSYLEYHILICLNTSRLLGNWLESDLIALGDRL
jgi:hypothetical protein